MNQSARSADAQDASPNRRTTGKATGAETVVVSSMLSLAHHLSTIASGISASGYLLPTYS